jgi:hypothetical protein
MENERFIFIGKEKLLEVRSRGCSVAISRTTALTALTALSVVGAIVFFISGFVGLEVGSHKRSFSFL